MKKETNIFWEVEELKKIGESQPDVVEVALKDLWRNRPELYKAVVMNAYIDEIISLSKAAELLNISRLELETEFRIKGIPIRHLSSEDIVAEVEAIKEW